MRAKVEHPFLVIKRLFGFAKTRYRGLDKNSNRLFVTCVLTNLSPHATAIVTHYVGDMQRFLAPAAPLSDFPNTRAMKQRKRSIMQPDPRPQRIHPIHTVFLINHLRGNQSMADETAVLTAIESNTKAVGQLDAKIRSLEARLGNVEARSRNIVAKLGELETKIDRCALPTFLNVKGTTQKSPFAAFVHSDAWRRAVRARARKARCTSSDRLRTVNIAMTQNRVAHTLHAS